MPDPAATVASMLIQTSFTAVSPAVGFPIQQTLALGALHQKVMAKKVVNQLLFWGKHF